LVRLHDFWSYLTSSGEPLPFFLPHSIDQSTLSISITKPILIGLPVPPKGASIDLAGGAALGDEVEKVLASTKSECQMILLPALEHPKCSPAGILNYLLDFALGRNDTEELKQFERLHGTKIGAFIPQREEKIDSNDVVAVNISPCNRRGSNLMETGSDDGLQGEKRKKQKTQKHSYQQLSSLEGLQNLSTYQNLKNNSKIFLDSTNSQQQKHPQSSKSPHHSPKYTSRHPHSHSRPQSSHHVAAAYNTSTGLETPKNKSQTQIPLLQPLNSDQTPSKFQFTHHYVRPHSSLSPNAQAQKQGQLFNPNDQLTSYTTSSPSKLLKKPLSNPTQSINGLVIPLSEPTTQNSIPTQPSASIGLGVDISSTETTMRTLGGNINTGITGSTETIGRTLDDKSPFFSKKITSPRGLARNNDENIFGGEDDNFDDKNNHIIDNNYSNDEISNEIDNFDRNNQINQLNFISHLNNNNISVPSSSTTTRELDTRTQSFLSPSPALSIIQKLGRDANGNIITKNENSHHNSNQNSHKNSRQNTPRNIQSFRQMNDFDLIVDNTQQGTTTTTTTTNDNNNDDGQHQ